MQQEIPGRTGLAASNVVLFTCADCMHCYARCLLCLICKCLTCIMHLADTQRSIGSSPHSALNMMMMCAMLLTLIALSIMLPVNAARMAAV